MSSGFGEGGFEQVPETPPEISESEMAEVMPEAPPSETVEPPPIEQLHETTPDQTVEQAPDSDIIEGAISAEGNLDSSILQADSAKALQAEFEAITPDGVDFDSSLVGQISNNSIEDAQASIATARERIETHAKLSAENELEQVIESPINESQESSAPETVTFNMDDPTEAWLAEAYKEEQNTPQEAAPLEPAPLDFDDTPEAQMAEMEAEQGELDSVGNEFEIESLESEFDQSRTIDKIVENSEMLSDFVSQGHGFEKHGDEFGGDRSQYAATMNEIIHNTPSENIKEGERQRVAFWSNEHEAIVILDENHEDGGTMFKPDPGKGYFDERFK